MTGDLDPADDPEYDPTVDAYRVTYDEPMDSPSMAVVRAVAALEDVEPVAVDPLYDAVDPDALDALVSSADADGDGDLRVSVTVGEYRVTISPTTIQLRSDETGA